MDEGDAMAASGAQGAAESAFRRADQALQQAAQDMQQMAQGNPQDGEQEADQAGKESGEGTTSGPHEVSIPAPEEFETPEAYRKALLEGMQGDVPEAYRAQNRRYYEELVRQ